MFGFLMETATMEEGKGFPTEVRHAAAASMKRAKSN